MTLVNLVTCLQEADESDYPEERYMSTNNYLYNQQLSPYYRQKLLLRQQLLKQQQMRRLLNHRNQLNNGILNTLNLFYKGHSFQRTSLKIQRFFCCPLFLSLRYP